MGLGPWGPPRQGALGPCRNPTLGRPPPCRALPVARRALQGSLPERLPRAEDAAQQEGPQGGDPDEGEKLPSGGGGDPVVDAIHVVVLCPSWAPIWSGEPDARGSAELRTARGCGAAMLLRCCGDPPRGGLAVDQISTETRDSHPTTAADQELRVVPLGDGQHLLLHPVADRLGHPGEEAVPVHLEACGVPRVHAVGGHELVAVPLGATGDPGDRCGAQGRGGDGGDREGPAEVCGGHVVVLGCAPIVSQGPRDARVSVGLRPGVFHPEVGGHLVGLDRLLDGLPGGRPTHADHAVEEDRDAPAEVAEARRGGPPARVAGGGDAGGELEIAHVPLLDGPVIPRPLLPARA